MQAVVQYIFAGLAIGGIYALVALGFHITWSAARAVNFAHGDTLMLGAVLAIMGLDAGLPFPVAVVLSLLASCIFGVLVERFAVRPFAKTATSIGWMLTTIAVGIMLEALVTMRFGGFSRALPSPGVAHAISIFGAGVYPQELLIPAVALVLMFGFGWMQRNTLIGRAMQAVGLNGFAVEGVVVQDCVLGYLVGAGTEVLAFEPERRTTMTPLRQRMIDDMRLAGFAERTRDVYIQAVRRLAAHYKRSPDVLSEEDVRAYLLHLRDERGIARGTFKTNHGGIRFLYSRTLDRDWPLFSQKNAFARRGSSACRPCSPMPRSAPSWLRYAIRSTGRALN